MSDWDILGIDPTDDLREIKRAYSRALRIHHPEKDPEGFQRLRTAYERLQACTKLSKQDETCDIDQEGAPPESTGAVEHDLAASSQDIVDSQLINSQEMDVPKSQDTTDPMVDLERAWDEFWISSENRNSLEAWRTLLSRHYFWDLKHKQTFNWLVLSCFQDAYHNNKLQGIPLQTWILLDHTFDWHAHELELSKAVDDDFLDHLMFKIREAAEVFEPDNYPKAIVVSKNSKKTGATAGSIGFSVLMILLFNIFKDCNDSNKRPIDLVPQYTTFKYRKIDDTNRNTQPSVEEVFGSRKNAMQYIRLNKGPYKDSNYNPQSFDSSLGR